MENKDIKTPETKVPAYVQQLIDANAKMSGEIQMLKDMVGKNSIASYEDGKKSFAKKQCHFKEWKGKLVIGWGDLDLTHYSPRAMDASGENMFVELIFDDGSKEKVNYIDFVRCNKLIKCEVIRGGQEISTVQLPDGQNVEIPTKFLNA